jgi:predicted ester cyclase
MTGDQNKNQIHHFLKKLDDGRDIIEEDCSPHLIAHLPGSREPTDRQGFKQFIDLFYHVFPDLHHSVDDQMAEGNKVVSRLTVRGTHRGFLQGLAPTGKPVMFSDILITQFEGGMITELWAQFDALGLLQQLGLIPPLNTSGGAKKRRLRT